MCAAHSNVCGWWVVSGAPNRIRAMVSTMALGKAVRVRASNAGCKRSAYESSTVPHDGDMLHIQRVCSRDPHYPLQDSAFYAG